MLLLLSQGNLSGIHGSFETGSEHRFLKALSLLHLFLYKHEIQQTLKITHSAVELLNENLRKSMMLIQLIAVSSNSPMAISESLNVWQDEILVLLCLIDDIQGILITDLSD